MRLLAEAPQDSALRRHLEAIQARCRDPRPATRAVMERVLARRARQRSPRGSGPARVGVPLSQSIRGEVTGPTTGELRSDKAYAAIQNTGGAIAPLVKQYLAIPVSDAARRLIASLGAGQSLRSVEGLIVIRSRKGELLLARYTEAASKAKGSRLRRDRRGRTRAAIRIGADDEGRQIEVLFVLRRRVTLAPNPSPGGYVPRLSEPDVLREAGEIFGRYVLEGRA